MSSAKQIAANADSSNEIHTGGDSDWGERMNSRTDHTQETHLQKLYEAAVQRRPPMRQLREKLLSLGGKNVVFFDDNLLADLLVERGRVYDGAARLILGAPNACHLNAQLLVLENPNRYLYATGYALSGGLWRMHSWVLVQKPRKYVIVETTDHRELYYGIDMPAEAVQLFFENDK